MKKNKLLLGILISLCALCLMFVALFTINLFNGDAILNNETENTINEEANNKQKLTRFEFIDQQLEADGFTYLEGTKWGRGENNFFIFDLETREFHVAEYSAAADMPEDWYKEFYNTYISYVFSYDTQNLVLSQNIINGNIYNLKEDDYTFYSDELKNTGIFYHEIPGWMNYYVDQFENYGCSIKGEFSEDTLETYKNQDSKASAADVVSVFDLKSTDGIVRTFNDVHRVGDVKDNPRYIEIQSFDEFYALKDATGFEVMYMFNIINSDKNKTFETETYTVQASAIDEFVKDVVYAFTPERNDAKQVETLGVYFIDVDNPNGNFKSLYEAPTKGKSFDFKPEIAGKDLRKLSIPYEGTVIGADKDITTNFDYIPFNIYDIQEVMAVYIRRIKYVNESVVFSEDFIRNYTRPFAYDWQEMMGLTELFDVKYGFVDHSIEYIN